VAFRKKIYRTIEELQADLDVWLADYYERRPHQGRWCFGKTPITPFLTHSLWQRRNLWHRDDWRLLYRLNQPTWSVRPNLN
jgi:hypothetical protein